MSTPLPTHPDDLIAPGPFHDWDTTRCGHWQTTTHSDGFIVCVDCHTGLPHDWHDRDAIERAAYLEATR